MGFVLYNLRRCTSRDHGDILMDRQKDIHSFVEVRIAYIYLNLITS